MSEDTLLVAEEETVDESNQEDVETHAPEFEDKPEGGESPKIFDEEKGVYFGKYKDEAEAYKAFKSLESENGKLRREKSPEAPEKYEFDFTDDDDLKDNPALKEIDFENDPIAKSVTEAFKEHGVTQEAANDIIKKYLQAELSQVPDLEEERKRLGDKGSEIIKEVSAFVHKNFNEEERAVINQLGSTAEGIKVLHKLSRSSSSSIPSDAGSGGFDPQELKDQAYELKKKHGGNLYGDNERRYEELMNKAISAELKQGGK